MHAILDRTYGSEASRYWGHDFKRLRVRNRTTSRCIALWKRGAMALADGLPMAKRRPLHRGHREGRGEALRSDRIDLVRRIAD